MKILSVVGARPQFIKLAPLSKEIRKYHKEIIVHTGQHFDNEMSKTFFEELDMCSPEYNLGISGGTHGVQTARMLQSIEILMINEKPDIVIVFGDTNSTLAASLAASKLHIKLVHIEAGLRSFNKKMPEEINRVVTDHISDFLFAPTQTAIENLNNEGLGSKAYYTGDIMVDSLNYAKSKILKENLTSNFNDYYLLTLHRPYNVDDPIKLQRIFNLLEKLDKVVIFPIHPRTKSVVMNNNISVGQNIKLIEPQGYIEFVKLQIYATKIITDSGGIQKEAYILKKPCITLRSETEWIETIKAGWNKLINLDEDYDIIEKIKKFTLPKEQADIFGENVAMKMINLINSIS